MVIIDGDYNDNGDGDNDDPIYFFITITPLVKSNG